MKKCDICGISSEEVRLYDAIYGLKMATLCERCSIIENIPIIKKPNSEQLKESETIRVSERMKDLSGIRDAEKPNIFYKEDRLRELDSNPELEKPEKENLNLLDNFHWEIMKLRRRKGMSQKQLSEYIGESEKAIEMIEKGKLPENAKKIISKIEQIFQSSLRKKPILESRSKPILISDEGKEIDYIPEEEEMIFVEEEEELPKKSIEQISLEHAEKALGIKIPERKEERIPYLPQNKDLDLNKINKEEVTIGQLQKLHEKRSVVVRNQQLEEQKKIEERNRILRESRERDKIRLEQQRQQAALEKQKAEDDRRKIIEQKRRELQEIREKEARSINNFLGGSELLEGKNLEDKEEIEEFEEII